MTKRWKYLMTALAVVFPLTALPLLALAQGAAQAPLGQQPAAGAQGPWGQGRMGRMDPERMQKRMRLARTLGLAEALDLEPAQALKLGETLGKFDDRRFAVRKQLRDLRELLKRAAAGEKVPAAEVDGAVTKGLELRGQLAAIDRDTINAVTQGLSPEKKARAVLFLSNFHRHFAGPGMRPGMGGPGGPGMGPGRGMGPGGHGRGQGGPGAGWGMGPGGDEGACAQLSMGPPPEDEED
jgi:hypothetical protein